MLARIRKAQENGEGGFTLIELLVVMIIIGILAAIAIPAFLSQKKKAHESAAKADAKSLATEVEAALTDGNPTAALSIAAVSGGSPTSFTVNGETFSTRTTKGNTVSGRIATDGTYCVQATTSDSPAVTWSVNGGQLVKASC